MTRPIALFILACFTIPLASACTRNIMVAKHGESYFLATKENGMKKLLCDSGDLKIVLSDANLGKELEQNLYSSICADQLDREKVLDILSGMTKDERERLKFSFEKNGYDVNRIIC